MKLLRTPTILTFYQCLLISCKENKYFIYIVFISCLQEHQTSDDTMKYCCKICFHRYNEDQRRPRVLPCGHSYCSHCISNHLVENKVVCPTCRKEHGAERCSDFSVNYEVEHNMSISGSSPDVESQMKTAPLEKPQGISRMLRSTRDEYCKQIQEAETEVREKKSNLEVYESQMNTWKEEHQKEMEFHLSCAQEHREVITSINKENQTVREASGQADNILKEVRTSGNDLNAADSNKNLLLSMEKSSCVYDSVQEWNSDIQKAYPNSKLIIRSQEVSIDILLKKNS